MWSASDTTMQMVVGDYGMALAITIHGLNATADDHIEMRFKNNKTGEVILTKNLTPVDDTIELEFSKTESDKFTVGTYSYAMDWYQNDRFMCNIIPSASFKVVTKI